MLCGFNVLVRFVHDVVGSYSGVLGTRRFEALEALRQKLGNGIEEIWRFDGEF